MFNPAIANRKYGRRGSALARAQSIAAKTPEGRVAQRLGQADVPLGVDAARKGSLDAFGRITRPVTPASVIEDARPTTNPARDFLSRRIPGSPLSR